MIIALFKLMAGYRRVKISTGRRDVYIWVK